MKIRRDPADLCRDAAGALLADLDRRFLADVWIVKAKHRHTGADHIHGRSILRRGFDEIDNALGQTSLTTQLIHAALEFFAIRQLVVPKKINYFFVTDFPGQLVDVVAAVNELAFVANDITQPRGVGDDAFESAGSHSVSGDSNIGSSHACIGCIDCEWLKWCSVQHFAELVDLHWAARYYVVPSIRAINVSAMVAGVSATAMPAAFSAEIFPAAVPFPPDTIAPA